MEKMKILYDIEGDYFQTGFRKKKVFRKNVEVFSVKATDCFLIEDSLQLAAGNLQCKELFYFIRSLDPAASCGEYARYPFKKLEVACCLNLNMMKMGLFQP